MKKIGLLFILIVVAVFVSRLPSQKMRQFPTSSPTTSSSINPESTIDETPRILVTGLETPWAIAFLPSGDLLVTERAGRIRFVTAAGDIQPEPVVTISSVKQLSEGGLHGIAIHPKFNTNHFVYVYYTYGERGQNTQNRVERYTYENNQLINEEIIVDAIPGAQNHDGGRLKFGPDGYLYITTGDAQQPTQAQDINSLAGKILRVNDDGTPAPGNPFNNRVYSYGHRNPQGITWDENGQLYETEHGPSGFETGNDEFNKIESGNNYGWPNIRGTQTRAGMVTPVAESGRGNTWAPAGLAFVNGSFYFAGLRGQALYKASPSGQIEELFKNEYGRLREVIVGPDNYLYISTSNRDGRGDPQSGDDKIIKIHPSVL